MSSSTTSKATKSTFEANPKFLLPPPPEKNIVNKNPEAPIKNPLSTKPYPEQVTPPYFCPRCKEYVVAEFRSSGQLSIGQRLELSCQCGSKMLYKSRTDRRMVYEAQ